MQYKIFIIYGATVLQIFFRVRFPAKVRYSNWVIMVQGNQKIENAGF
jgi:hypothetical protein